MVGQNVPFVTGTQLSASNNNPFQTIERQDVGISLKVKPQINEGDNIKMEIEQEVSDVANTAVTGASDIVTQHPLDQDDGAGRGRPDPGAGGPDSTTRSTTPGTRCRCSATSPCWDPCSVTARTARARGT